jgi:hypothetical protein
MFAKDVYEHSGVNHFEGAIEILDTFPCLGCTFDSVDSYDFSTLYSTLPHKLIKDKFSYLIKWSFVNQAVSNTSQFIDDYIDNVYCYWTYDVIIYAIFFC